jgi:hypothetical protein
MNGNLIRPGLSAQAQVEKMMLDAFEGANDVYALARSRHTDKASAPNFIEAIQLAAQSRVENLFEP